MLPWRYLHNRVRKLGTNQSRSWFTFNLQEEESSKSVYGTGAGKVLVVLLGVRETAFSSGQSVVICCALALTPAPNKQPASMTCKIPACKAVEDGLISCAGIASSLFNCIGSITSGQKLSSDYPSDHHSQIPFRSLDKLRPNVIKLIELP